MRIRYLVFPCSLSASPTSERQGKTSLGCSQDTLLWSFPSGVGGDPHLDITSKIITKLITPLRNHPAPTFLTVNEIHVEGVSLPNPERDF